MFLLSLSAICFACSSQDLIVNENMSKGVSEEITDLSEEVTEEKGTPGSNETERRVDESVETSAAENKRPTSAIYRPELTGISGYINVEKFLLDDLQGKVILIDLDMDVWLYISLYILFLLLEVLPLIIIGNYTTFKMLKYKKTPQ